MEANKTHLLFAAIFFLLVAIGLHFEPPATDFEFFVSLFCLGTAVILFFPTLNRIAAAIAHESARLREPQPALISARVGAL